MVSEAKAGHRMVKGRGLGGRYRFSAPRTGGCTACRSHESWISAEHLNAICARHEYLTLAHCNALGGNKLACSFTFLAPLPHKRTVQTKHLNTIVIHVGHKHFIPFHSHTTRLIELPLSTAFGAPLPHKGAIQTEPH